MAAAAGSKRAEEVIEALRKKHVLKESKALPAKSTVGIVLEGLMVNLVVPGSPAHKLVDDQRIEAEDIVLRIDGQEVDKKNIISKLRGSDTPGQVVKVTVQKHDTGDEVDFALTRADMRTVMNYKDMYLALGEVHSEMRDPDPERLVPLVETLEGKIKAVTDFAESHENGLRGHIAELEDSFRKEMGKVDELQGEVADLRKQLDSQAQGSSGAAAQANKELEKLKKELAEAQKLKSEAEKNQRELERERDDNRRKLEEMKSTGAQLQGSQAELEKAKKQMQDLQTRLKAAEEVAQGTQGELDKTKKQALELQAKLKATEDQAKKTGDSAKRAEMEKEQSAAKQAALQQQLDEAQVELQRSRASEKSAKAQLDGAKAKAEEFVARATAAEGREEKSRNEKGELMKKIAEAEKELSSLKAKEQELKHKLDIASAQLKRQTEDAERGSKRLEDSVHQEADKARAALMEAQALKDEIQALRNKNSSLDFTSEQHKNRAADLQEQLNALSLAHQKSEAQVESLRSTVRALRESESALKGQIDVAEKSKVHQDQLLIAQMNTLRADSAEMRKTLDSLRDERRQARETIAKQQVEIQTLKSLPKDAVAGPRDVESAQRLKMLEKMLQVREEEKAELEEQLLAAQKGSEGVHAAPQARGQPRSRPPRAQSVVNSGVPLFNSRTDDILQTTGACILCAGMVYGAVLLQHGEKGGVLGLIVVVGSIFGGLFGLLTLFKAFLWMLGGGDEQPKHRYSPIEAMQPVVDQTASTPPPLDSVRIQDQPPPQQTRSSWTGSRKGFRDYNSINPQP